MVGAKSNNLIIVLYFVFDNGYGWVYYSSNFESSLKLSKLDNKAIDLTSKSILRKEITPEGTGASSLNTLILELGEV
jgi:hypothetical protein